MEELSQRFPNLVVDLSNYRIETLISSNSHSSVYMATEISTNAKIIIKQFHTKKLDEAFETGFCLEASIPLKVDSPFVVKTLGFTNKPPYSIIQEYNPNKSLAELLYKSSYYLAPTHKMLISMCLAHALMKMHKLAIVHRNLTPIHILIDQYLLPHISSFGSSQLAEGKCVKEFQDIYYVAPELLSEQKYSEKIDVFSYGMILYELLANCKPFKNYSPFEVQINLLSKEISLPEIPNDTPPPLRELILSCWNLDFSKRPSFSEIYQKFSQKTVFFHGFDPLAIDSVIRSIDNNVEVVIPSWATKTNFKVVNSLFDNAIAIYDCFKSQTTIMLSDLFECANSSNVDSFFKVLLNIIKKDEDQILVGTAVSSALQLMSQNPVYFDYFVRHNLYQSLPLEKSSNLKYVLSLLIPVFQVNPNLATPELISRIIANAQSCPVKVFRVLATVCNKFTADWINWQIVDLLFLKRKIFLESKAGSPFLYLFYRLMSYLDEIKVQRGSLFLECVQYSVKSQDPKTVKAGYSIILALNLTWIKPELIHMHLCNEIIQGIALNYLCSAPLSFITVPTLRSLCHISRVPLASALLLKFAQDQIITQKLLTIGPDLAKLDSKNLVKVLLEIMIHKDNRAKLMNLSELPFMINKISMACDSLFFEALSKIIRSLPITQDFLVRLSQNNCIITFISQAVKCDTYQSHIACLVTIDRIIRYGYLPEYAAYFDVAISLLTKVPQLTVHVITYLSLLSASEEGLVFIRKNSKIPQIIQQYQNVPQYQKQIEFLQINFSSFMPIPS